MPADHQTETTPGDLPDFGATSTAPPLEQEAPAGALPATEGTNEEDVKPKLPVFSPKHRDALDGLLYTGRLERSFTWASHRFRIKTLTSGERLKLGSLTRMWVGTTEEARAWVIAQVGLCVLSVDGKSTIESLGPDEDLSELKFQWAQKQYPWTIDAVFLQLTDLEADAKQVADEMGKA